MNIVARFRHVLARRPWLYWLSVLLLGGGLALVVARAAAGIEEARDAWGEPLDVYVAVIELAPGDPVADHVERRAAPAPVVPTAALTALPDGAVARQHVSFGEIVVEADVAPSAAPQALIPDGWAAVAVAEAVPSGARIGDDVRPVSGGVELAPAGVVVGYGEESVLVAVPAADAAAVAMAAASGELALLLEP
jgi:hypothetical protein